MIRLGALCACVAWLLAGCGGSGPEPAPSAPAAEGQEATAREETPLLRLGSGEELIEERRGHRLVPQIRRPSDSLVRQLQLPAGFRVDRFAGDLGRPRMMATGPDGTIYVTRPDSGDVLTLRDRDGDGKAEQVQQAVRGLSGVHGVTFHQGRLYLATVDAVYRVEAQGGRWGEPVRILHGLPPGGRHPNRTLAFGPDGQLYITVGSTCNCCLEPHRESATVLRVRPDGSERTLFATGLRNTVGFAWNPATGELWGMDHGTDWLGDDTPPEELNHLEQGKHYGWPFLYGKNQVIELRDYPAEFDREQYVRLSTPSVLEYTAHAAPLQMAFYTGRQFPQEYRNDAFVAMHGSWNRRPPSGYEVVRIRFGLREPARFEPFLTGFLIEGGRAAFGRPAGLTIAQDGALLVGDDANGVIYRVSYRAGR